jgi:hypothetical protein
MTFNKQNEAPPDSSQQRQGFRMTSVQQRAALQSQIWKIANDVRGAVDVWIYEQYEHHRDVLLSFPKPQEVLA